MNSVVCKEKFLCFEKGKEYKIKDFTEYSPGKISSLCLKLNDNLHWWVSDDELNSFFVCNLNQMRNAKLKRLRYIQKRRRK